MLENPRKLKNPPKLLVPFCENYKIFRIFKKITMKSYSFFQTLILMHSIILMHFIFQILRMFLVVLAHVGGLNLDVQIAFVPRIWRKTHLPRQHISPLTEQVLLQVEHHLLNITLFVRKTCKQKSWLW